MNLLSFIKYCIVDGLKPFFPEVELGKPKRHVSYLGKSVSEKVPVDYVCKGLCSECKYNERN